MHHVYKTQGTCSQKIEFDIEDDRIYNLQYTGGCPGNLKAISKLVEGEKIETIIKKVKGITCGMKKTSCADQLAKALQEIKKVKL